MLLSSVGVPGYTPPPSTLLPPGLREDGLRSVCDVQLEGKKEEEKEEQEKEEQGVGEKKVLTVPECPPM